MPESTGQVPVIFLIHDLRVGGAERAFVHYVNHATTLRAIPVAVTRGGALTAELAPDATLHALGESPGPAWPPGALVSLVRKAARLAALVRETGAAAVCAFLHKACVIGMATKLLFRPELRVIINVHSMTTRALDYVFANRLERVGYRWFVRHCFPRADLIVTVADGVKEDLLEMLGVPSTRIAVAHNPVDVEEIRRRAAEPAPLHELGAGRPLVVAVGRLDAIKGHDLLIRAFAASCRRTDAHLVIVGDGPQRSQLERLVADLRLTARVRLLGARANPWQYMARADVFVLPSRVDAFPSVIGEALALGVPVVASDCSPGVHQYLQGGRCGVLVTPGDPAALADGVTRVLADADLRQRLRERGRARVEEFALRRAVSHYEALVRKILGPSDPHGRLLS